MSAWGDAATDAEAEGQATQAPTEAEARTATATENEAGGIDLTIDLSILPQSPQALSQALIRNRLLGPNWATSLPTRSDFVGRKILTLTDYKRRHGIT